MSKYIILIMIFISMLCVSVFVYAQVYDQAKGKQVIEKSITKNKTYKSQKIEFKYTMENKMDSSKTSESGTLFLKDGCFKIILGDQTVLCDKKSVWTYLKDANEVQINAYNPTELELNPNEIFTLNMWETDFLYGYAGQQLLNSRYVDLIELTPHNKTRPYFKMKIYIDKTSKDIQKLMIFYKNSSIITIDVKALTPNILLDAGFFNFNPKGYPGIEVVDLRE